MRTTALYYTQFLYKCSSFHFFVYFFGISSFICMAPHPSHIFIPGICTAAVGNVICPSIPKPSLLWTCGQLAFSYPRTDCIFFIIFLWASAHRSHWILQTVNYSQHRISLKESTDNPSVKITNKRTGIGC